MTNSEMGRTCVSNVTGRKKDFSQKLQGKGATLKSVTNKFGVNLCTNSNVLRVMPTGGFWCAG